MTISSLKALAVGIAFSIGAATGAAQAANPMVGGAPMYASKNIIQNAMHSKDHTTLVAAVKAAGLVQTLEGPGPFTVLAPTNEAFAKLPAGTVKSLLDPANKAKLTKILECHVISGKITSGDIASMAKAHGGMFSYDTLGGCKLTFADKGGKVTVTDENGDTAKVTISDVMQSHGVIHVINTVLLPKS
jgi:uncharacterized surface protein with fasciclin (FAS1) repeats